MNKEQVISIFANEYLTLWRDRQVKKNREGEKDKAIQTGDMHKLITISLEQAESKARLEQFKRMSTLLELDWIEVRKLVEAELEYF